MKHCETCGEVHIWPGKCRVCPNCGQWVRKGNQDDCFNECNKRGFVSKESE